MPTKPNIAVLAEGSYFAKCGHDFTKSLPVTQCANAFIASRESRLASFSVFCRTANLAHQYVKSGKKLDMGKAETTIHRLKPTKP